jgi:hypothetical protein
VIQFIVSTYDNATTTIIDDDTAGISSWRIFGNTYENGNSTNFPIVLTSQPTSTVTLGLASSDTTEGNLSPTSLTFDGTNWNTPQVITMTGVDDTLTDGHITYTVNLNSITSGDVRYAALVVPTVVATVTNIDDETAANLPPTVTLTINTIAISENTSSPAIPFTVADDSTPVGNITVTISSTNQTLLPDANISHGGAGTANQTVTLTPVMSQSGTAIVQIVATDSDGASTTKIIILTVDPNNRPPVANNDTKHVVEDGTATIAILANDTDADGTLDVSSVTITVFPSSGTQVKNATDGSVTYTPNANFSGSDSFTYRVKDNDGLDSNPAIVFIGVTAVNDAPTVANIIPAQNAIADVLFNYTVPANTFSDVDGDILTYSAKQADGSALPDWLSFVAGTRTFTGTPTNTDTGLINIELTVIDPTGASVSTNFNLTVMENNNTKPILVGPIADQTATADQPFGLNIAPNFRDADVGDTLTYTATRLDGNSLPSWLSFNPITGQFSGTPPANVPTEVFKLRVMASDKMGASISSNDFTFNIQGKLPSVTPSATITPAVTPTSTPTPSSTGSITGTVRGGAPNGVALANISVIADYFDGTKWQTFVANTSTDANGNYVLSNLKAGTYRLHFVDIKTIYANLYYANTSDPDNAMPITIDAGQTTSNINMTLLLANTLVSSISGNVSTQTGEPDVAGGWPGSYMTVDFAVTCASGASPTEVNLLVGTQSLPMRLKPTGGYSATLTTFPVAGDYPIEVEWRCDGVIQNAKIGQLYVPATTATGLITGNGQPLHGATVTLYKMPGSGRQTTCPATPSNGVQVDPQLTIINPPFNPQITGADGRYAWTVPAGCWYITAQAQGYEAKTSRPVSVDAISLDLELGTDTVAVYLPVVLR